MQGPEDEDDAWARAISDGVSRGSPAALESLYRARSARLFRLVQSRTKRDDAFVFDCVHDAWVRIVRHLPACSSLDGLDRWLSRAALSASIDRLRTDAARARRERSAEHDPTVPHPAPRGDEVHVLLEEYQRLSDDDRTVLRLRYRSGLPIEAIAQALGLGAKAIEIRIRRAVARLRNRLDREQDRGPA